MFKKQLNILSILLIGITLIFLGILFIYDPSFAISTSYTFFVITLIVLTILSIIYVIFTRWTNRKITLLIQVLLLIIIGIYGFNHRSEFFQYLPIVLGIYLLIQASVKVISLYLIIIDKLPGAKWLAFKLFFNFVMGCLLTFDPLNHGYIAIYVMGTYFIIYGSSYVYRSLTALIPSRVVDSIDEKFYLSIPTILGALLPPHLMKVILSKSEIEQRSEEFDAIKDNIECELEVLVHVAKSGPAQLGHCDLVYQGVVLSYGCYDPHTRHLFGTYGDGVVLLADRDEYLYNCLERENKVLVCFGIALNKKQKESLDQALITSFEKFVPFESDENLRSKGIELDRACDDYLSRVSRNVEFARYYKISEGRYKTFFVFYSNCVSYVSKLLSAVGLRLFDFSGIISPGAYFDFLNSEFKSSKGHVVSRKVYTKKDAHQFIKTNNNAKVNV